ncbi:MAG: RNA methyltransferase [Betaproteobacteria bacterium]|nr:RNA methyltransferase [Betaproteobacteria bacterium]
MADLLKQFRVVLCRTSHPGNIGATARAMKTMGLADLRLVAPLRFPAPEAEWMASNANDVLENARVHATLAEAIGDCVAGYALSARPREWSLAVRPVRDAALEAVARAASGPVAIVFGSEKAGLSNEELLTCQTLVHIPVDPGYTSLNLSQAVQVVAYELRMACGGGAVPPPRAEALATVADVESLYAYLEKVSAESGFFDPVEPKRLRERFRRLFSRIVLEREEVNILRGLLKSLTEKKNL